MKSRSDRKKLKDAIAEYLEREIMAPPRIDPKHFPKPIKLRGRGSLTTEEIEAAINWGARVVLLIYANILTYLLVESE